jgi:hypothetical protein
MTMARKVETDKIVATAGIADKMEEDLAFTALVKKCLDWHLSGDWGDLCEEDRQANEDALKNGDRLLSAYGTRGDKIWIITEWDRSVTTVLFPDEY